MEMCFLKLYSLGLHGDVEVFKEAVSPRSMGHFILALEVPVLQETTRDWRTGNTFNSILIRE